MADVLLNGRVPEPWEAAALKRGTACDRARGEDLLAGLLAKYPRPEPDGPPGLLPPLGTP